IYVSSENAETEEKYILDLFKKAGFSKGVFVQDEPDISLVNDRVRRATQDKIRAQGVRGKIVFMKSFGIRDSRRQYEVTAELKEEPAVSTERLRQLKPVQPPLPSLSMRDIGQELAFGMKNPGFDGILIAVDFPDSQTDSMKKAAEKNYQDVLRQYGINVPVRFVYVEGVSKGNGLPALMLMSAEAGFREELASKKVSPKLAVIEAFGPQYDPARLMAGSTFFSLTGYHDNQDRPIATGMVALARASIALRGINHSSNYHTMRLKTDTFHLHRARPDLSGEINLATALLPAKKAASLGVPLFKKGDTRQLYGFIEKGARDFKRLYAQKMGMDAQQINNETRVPVFTGDILSSFSPERQKLFDELALATLKEWRQAIESGSEAEFDEVLDFWVPLIFASNGIQTADALNALRLYVNYRAGVTSSGRTISQQENIERHAVYTELYTSLFQKANRIGFQVHGQMDEQASFRDVRRLKDLVKALRYSAEENSFGFKKSDSGRAVTFGLNGSSPETATKVHAFMMAVPYKGTQAVVYGALDNFKSGRPDSLDLGIPVQRIWSKSNRPIFNEDMPFEDMPIFPTGEPQRLINESLVALLNGKTIRFPVDSPDELRKSGYVSLREIAEGYNPERGGIQAPVFKHPPHLPSPMRSEVREFVFPEVLKSASPFRSEARLLIEWVRTGAAAATLIIFYGVLPVKAISIAAKLESHAGTIIASAWSADKRELILNGLGMLESNPVAKVNAQQTLFVDGDLIAGREILAELEKLSESEFGIELLFTDPIGFDAAKKSIGGKTELGKLKIRLGATIGEMVAQVTAAQGFEALDMKKNFAFLGKDEAMARRLRANVANLMVLKQPDTIPAEMLLEALLSPAVFSLNFKPNKIWALDSALPMLLAARQIARSA
ncbi:MAG TPA: hypothetical protein DIS66_00470, partial [Candidatus Omnitrophica bacterium]|nr:hypothetical protein [Candidatus Omnitrophota bacterium]